MTITKTLFSTFLAALMLTVFAPTASAVPIGVLSVGICPGGGVRVDINSIDFLNPANEPATGTGCIVTGITTNVSYTGGGPLGPGIFGTIKDLEASSGLPVLDFMTFAGNPNLHFDLTSLGPGVGNFVCSNTNDPNQPDCSVVAGSPFILSPEPGGVGVTLSTFGIARDSSGVNSLWTGGFSVQLTSIIVNGVSVVPTPAQIQAIILQGGSVIDTHSGSFRLENVQAIPEPASLLLLGSGLIATGVRARRARRRKAE